MKASFLKATLAATDIPHQNLYLPTDSVKYVASGTVSLTFDILPLSNADVHSYAQQFISAVGDPNTELYGEEMRLKCPIDIGFQPDVQIIVRNPEGRDGTVDGLAVGVTLGFMVVLAGLGYYYRRQIRNFTLRKLAKWKFEEMREEDLPGDGGPNPMHGILDGIRGQFRNVKDRYFGLNQEGYDGFRENEDDLQMSEGVRHSYSIDDGDDEDGGINYDRDGNEIGLMGKANGGVGEGIGGGESLLTTKKVLQIEL